MFGMANQLLAVIALGLVTTMLVNTGKGRYAPVTLLPMLFVTTTTMTAGCELITIQFPAIIKKGEVLRGWLNIGLTLFVIVSVALLLMMAASRWIGVWMALNRCGPRKRNEPVSFNPEPAATAKVPLTNAPRVRRRRRLRDKRAGLSDETTGMQ